MQLNKLALAFSVAALCGSVFGDGIKISSFEKIGDCQDLNIVYTVDDRSIYIHFLDSYKVATESEYIKKVCILNFEMSDTPKLQHEKSFSYAGNAITDYSMTGKVTTSLRRLGELGEVTILKIDGDNDLEVSYVSDSIAYTTQKNFMLEYRIDLSIYGETNNIEKESIIHLHDAKINL